MNRNWRIGVLGVVLCWIAQAQPVMALFSRGLQTDDRRAAHKGVAGEAPGIRFSRMYVFGDSYSDSGAGYVDGNGPTAVVYLARLLRLSLTYAGDPQAAPDSGLNFAVSGAPSGENEGKRFNPNDLLGRGMMNQVRDFAQQVASGKIHFDPDKTVCFLLGGLNDSRLPDGQTKANLEKEVDLLYETGIRHTLVGNLPTVIPSFSAVAKRLNPEIAQIPAEEHRLHPSLNIQLLPWGSDFDFVFQHAAQFGILNTTDRCAGRALFNEDTTPCAAPDTYFYFHESHPSTATHRAVGGLLFEQLSGEKPGR